MAQVKEATGTSFRINTICDFKTFKKAVELNRLSLKFVLLCHEDIHESFHKDNANFDSLSLSRYFGRVEGAGESIFWVFKEPTI